MCVTRKENLEKTADKIIEINAAIGSEVLHAKNLSGSLQCIVFATESLRENGCEYLDLLEDYLALSKDVAKLARKLSSAATNAKKYKEREEEQERKEQEERERMEREEQERKAQEERERDKKEKSGRGDVLMVRFNIEEARFLCRRALRKYEEGSGGDSAESVKEECKKDLQEAIKNIKPVLLEIKEHPFLFTYEDSLYIKMLFEAQGLINDLTVALC